MTDFSSKYEIGDLVEYKQDRNDDYTLFGHIVEIVVYKPTSTLALKFNIRPVNRNAEALEYGIYESNILRRFSNNGA